MMKASRQEREAFGILVNWVISSPGGCPHSWVETDTLVDQLVGGPAPPPGSSARLLALSCIIVRRVKCKIGDVDGRHL